jgi:archaellum component FlaC
LSDAKKKEEALSRASMIVEAVHAENKILRAKLHDRDGEIEDLRRLDKDVEQRLVQLQQECLNVAKLRTVETRLRSEIEGLKHENELLLQDQFETTEKHSTEMVLLEEQNNLLQSKVRELEDQMNRLARADSMSSTLLEDSLAKIRRLEEEHTMLTEVVETMRRERSKTAEAHTTELTSLSEANKRLLEILKSTRGEGSVGVMASRDSRVPVVLESLYFVLDTIQHTHSFLSTLAEREIPDLEDAQLRAEANLKALDSKKLRSKEQAQIEALLQVNSRLESTIMEQNDLIYGLTEYANQTAEFINCQTQSTQTHTFDLARIAATTVDSVRRQLKAVDSHCTGLVTSAHDELSRVRLLIKAALTEFKLLDQPTESLAEDFKQVVAYVRKVREEKDGVLSQLAEANLAKDDLVAKMQELLADLSSKGKDIDKLHEANILLTDQVTSLHKKVIDTARTAQDSHRIMSTALADVQSENDRLIKKCEDLALISLNRREEGPTNDDRDCQLQLRITQKQLSTLQFELKEKDLEIEAITSELKKAKDKLMFGYSDKGRAKEHVVIGRENALDLKRASLAQSTTNRTTDHTDLSIRAPFVPVSNTIHIRQSLHTSSAHAHLSPPRDDLAAFEEQLFSNAEFD